MLVLEELEHARARGAPVLAEVRGYGCSADAYHITAPREDGAGALLAMKMALRNAAVKPAQVDYINAHATGTAIGDAAEAAAIRTLMLGDDGVSSEAQVTVSSTKGATGHLLGAAGALEAVFSVLAITHVSPRLSARHAVALLTSFPPPEHCAAHAESSQTQRRGQLQLRPPAAPGEGRQSSALQQLRLRRHQRVSGVRAGRLRLR